MISFHDMRRALDKLGIAMSNLQLNNLMNEVFPNSQAGFSCGGATVWGDSKSIDIVKLWLHSHGNIEVWRKLLDEQRQRATRAEELGSKLLNFALRCSADNPAAIGHAVTSVHDLLDELGIEPRVGFFHTQEGALADAREKFYAAAHPRPQPEGLG